MAIRGDIEVPKEVELDHRTYPETEMLKERLEWCDFSLRTLCSSRNRRILATF